MIFISSDIFCLFLHDTSLQGSVEEPETDPYLLCLDGFGSRIVKSGPVTDKVQKLHTKIEKIFRVFKFWMFFLKGPFSSWSFLFVLPSRHVLFFLVSLLFVFPALCVPLSRLSLFSLLA
jgi:hypothetical protein